MLYLTPMMMNRATTVEKIFGGIVQNHRKHLGLSQEELASRSGLHRTYISQLERGLKSPSLRTVFTISSALGIKPGVLLLELAGLRSGVRTRNEPFDKIESLIQAMLRVPFFKSLPGAILEEILAHVYGGSRTGTYDFADVVAKDSRVGWQVKSTRIDTPVTWKRVKLPDKMSLITASQKSSSGVKDLGDAIIAYCNRAARESVEKYKLTTLRYARLVDYMDGRLMYFERDLSIDGLLFNPADFMWVWSETKKATRKEQLSAFHGIHKATGQAWFAWHGLGENQLHFKGERHWWPSSRSETRRDFHRSGEILELDEFAAVIDSIGPSALPTDTSLKT